MHDAQQLLALLIFFAEKSGSVQSRVDRERARGARRSSTRSVGRRVEHKLTDAGHLVLGMAPWFRPALRRIKHGLRRF